MSFNLFFLTHLCPSFSLPLGSLTFITKLPISLDLFLSKARHRHFYGNHCCSCVDLQRALKLFRLPLPYQVIQGEMEMEGWTLTSTKTDSDVEEVK